MKDFCHHCGRELNGDEPVCPGCGAPTGFAQPYYYQPPKRSGTNVAIIVIAAVAVLCIVGIAFLPTLIPQQETYTVTIRVDEIKISDSTGYYGGDAVATLHLTIDDKSVNVGPWNCIIGVEKICGGPGDTVKMTYRGSLDDIKITAFLYFSGGGHTSDDYADLYDVTDKVTSTVTTPHYYGCSGVSFNLDDVQSSVVELKGDSDPVGYVKLTVNAVKN